MSQHRYERGGLYADFARAGIGLVLCGGAAWMADFSGFSGWLFGICAAVFLLFGLRTCLRAVTNYELTETGLTRSYGLGVGRAERTLAWRGLKTFRLRYFPAKRDRSRGWMELSLADGEGRMRIDSTLAGFDAVLRVAVGAAQRNRVALSDTTLSNLAALGAAVAQEDGGDSTKGGSPGGPVRP